MYWDQPPVSLSSDLIGNIPQRFWSKLSWQHHTVGADVSAAHPWWESHHKTALLEGTRCHVQNPSLKGSEFCDTLFCWTQLSEDGCTGVHKGMVTNNTHVDCGVSSSLLLFNQPEPLTQSRMEPCFHLIYTTFWSPIPSKLRNSRLIRPGEVSPIFCCPILMSLCKLQPVSCVYLTALTPSLLLL